MGSVMTDNLKIYVSRIIDYKLYKFPVSYYCRHVISVFMTNDSNSSAEVYFLIEAVQ